MIITKLESIIKNKKNKIVKQTVFPNAIYEQEYFQVFQGDKVAFSLKKQKDKFTKATYLYFIPEIESMHFKLTETQQMQLWKMLNQENDKRQELSNKRKFSLEQKFGFLTKIFQR